MSAAGGGRPYSDPYVAGAVLGLVLLASFVASGRGLGASGAFVSSAASIVEVVAPAHAAASPVLAVHAGGGGPWRDWLVWEIAGVVAGGHLSARAAARLAPGVERGSGITVRARIGWAFGGGALMGAGAVVARGCTSGLALSGGAVLAVGSWIFMIAAFAAAYLVAPLTRRAWR